MGLRWKEWELGFACLNLNWAAVLNLDISGMFTKVRHTYAPKLFPHAALNGRYDRTLI